MNVCIDMMVDGPLSYMVLLHQHEMIYRIVLRREFALSSTLSSAFCFQTANARVSVSFARRLLPLFER
jgi:hypothetical protein